MNNINKKSDTEDSVTAKIISIIEDIRPYLNMDGGDISFVKYENGCVYVKLLGACAHCMSQDDTINEGILLMIKEQVPEVDQVINVLL